jgi:hypothetical protein
MSKSGIRLKHATDTVQLHRISHLTSHPYKEGPHARGNGASTQDALEDKDKDQRIYHPTEDQAEGLPGGVRPNPGFGRPWPGSRPGASRGRVAATPPDHLPYAHLAGTDL